MELKEGEFLIKAEAMEKLHLGPSFQL